MFYPPLTFAVFFAMVISFAMLSAKVAGQKGFNPVDWGTAGVFLGPIALIAAAGLPDLTTRKLLREYLDRLN